MVDRIHAVRNLAVKSMPGRHKHDTRTLLLHLPYGICCLYTSSFCKLILCHNNACPILRITSHCHRNILQFRAFKALTGCKEIVAITVEN